MKFWNAFHLFRWWLFHPRCSWRQTIQFFPWNLRIPSCPVLLGSDILHIGWVFPRSWMTQQLQIEASKGGDDMKWQLVYLTDLWNDKAEASSSFSEVDPGCLLQIFGHTLISQLLLTKTLQKRKAKQLGLVFGHAISVSISDPKLTIFDQSDTSCITTSPWLSWEDLQFFDASHRWRLSGAISFSTDACGIPFDSMDVKRYQKKQDRDIWKQHKDGWRVYLTANRPWPWPFF